VGAQAVDSCSYSHAFAELKMRKGEEFLHCGSEMNERVWKEHLLGGWLKDGLCGIVCSWLWHAQKGEG
jgi:hypothetical protein